MGQLSYTQRLSNPQRVAHLAWRVAAKNIDIPGFGPNGNTCATRLSVAFNKAGAKIIPFGGIETLGTADGSRIIFRVREFRKYILHTLGKPSKDITNPFDSNFIGKKGVIAFSVTGWSNASGHIALWDGVQYREPPYDDYSRYRDERTSAQTTQAEFWELI
ncbi:MAG: type VI secretion system amidase effector protein Tae4 [Maricaulaceae bacterium]